VCQRVSTGTHTITELSVLALRAGCPGMLTEAGVLLAMHSRLAWRRAATRAYRWQLLAAEVPVQ